MLAKFKQVWPAGLWLVPTLALGASGTILGVIDTIDQAFQAVIPIILALIIIYFLYGLAKYILAAGDSDAASEGKSIMIYGVIAMFVAFSIWGIIALLQNSFGVDGGDAGIEFKVPNLGGSGSGGGGNPFPSLGEDINNLP